MLGELDLILLEPLGPLRQQSEMQPTANPRQIFNRPTRALFKAPAKSFKASSMLGSSLGKINLEVDLMKDLV